MMSVKIDLKIFLFLFLFLLTSQIEIYVVLLLFAIIHELGHLIMGAVLGFRPEEIKLTPVGLQMKFKMDNLKMRENISTNNQLSNSSSSKVKNNLKINGVNTLCIKKAIIALAGPITNLLIAVIVIIIGSFNANIINTYLYQIIIYSNFLIAIFNLIPIYPMDGGRIINETIKLFYGNKVAYKLTYIISKTVLILLTAISSIVILYIHNISIVIILAYLWYLEILEIRRYNRRKNIEKLIEQIDV